MFSAWALGFQNKRESSVVAANSPMFTAAYQTKASVRAGYVIHNSQRADEFPRGIRIIGLGNLFQGSKKLPHPNQCRGQYKFSNAGPKFVNCIRHLAMGRIVCTLKMARIVCTLTDKNVRRQAREYPKKQPIYPKKQRVSTEWSGDAVGNPCPQTAMANSSNRCRAVRPAPFVTFRWHIGKESRTDFELELLIARARVSGRRPPNAGI